MGLKEKALNLLEGSIIKWQMIVDGTGADEGTKNCPLCEEYIDSPLGEINDKDCNNCPVYEKTGMTYCEYTPYEDWLNINMIHPTETPAYADSEVKKEKAKAMLDFLIELKEDLTKEYGRVADW